jgi:hypothetical protein
MEEGQGEQPISFGASWLLGLEEGQGNPPISFERLDKTGNLSLIQNQWSDFIIVRLADRMLRRRVDPGYPRTHVDFFLGM